MKTFHVEQVPPNMVTGCLRKLSNWNTFLLYGDSFPHKIFRVEQFYLYTLSEKFNLCDLFI